MSRKIINPTILFLLIFPALLFAQTITKEPNTFLLDKKALLQNKTKLTKGDMEIKAALQDLKVAADQALTHWPYSVVAKSKIPPSGDKHDYMSVGPYWWPDPSKPNGLPYIRKDGETNPERHTVKDSDYLKELSKDVTVLAVAYYFTGDKKYAAHAEKLIDTWFIDEKTKMNPNLNYGQAIPGITDGRGIGLIDSKCLVNLVDGVQLLESGGYELKNKADLQEWFISFLNWMLNSPIGKDEADEHNNHGVYYDVQAATFALFTGKKDLARQLLQKNSLPRIDSQIKPDGSQPAELARTKSWGYSFMNLKGFIALAKLGEAVGLEVWQYKSPQGGSIKNAYNFMVPFVLEQKPWTYKQISSIDRSEFMPLARMAATANKDLDIRPLQNKLKNTGLDETLSILTNGVFY